MAESARIIAHQCAHCGASIDFKAGTGTTTCVYCGSQLRIEPANGGKGPVGSEAVNQQPKDVIASVQVLRLQQELKELDRSWELKQQQLTTKDAQGNVLPPSKAGAYFTAALAVGFGIFLGAGMTCSGLWLVGPLAGTLFVGLGILTGIYETKQADRFSKAQQRYETQRQQLLRAIRGDQP